MLNSLRESFITQSTRRCRAAEEETSGTFLEIIHNAIIAFSASLLLPELCVKTRCERSEHILNSLCESFTTQSYLRCRAAEGETPGFFGAKHHGI
jgi:hypothetical protein